MRTILLIMALLCSIPLFSQRRGPVKTIEKLAYTGYYNWGFIWIKAGSVEFTLTPSGKYPHAQRLFEVGRTSS